MKKTEKWLALLLSIAIVFSVCPVAGAAAAKPKLAKPVANGKAAYVASAAGGLAAQTTGGPVKFIELTPPETELTDAFENEDAIDIWKDTTYLEDWAMRGRYSYYQFKLENTSAAPADFWFWVWFSLLAFADESELENGTYELVEGWNPYRAVVV